MKPSFPIIDIKHKEETQSIQYIQYNYDRLFVIFFTSYTENIYLEIKNIYICIKELITQLRTACST